VSVRFLPMSPPEQSETPAEGLADEGMVTIAVYPDANAGFDHGLVVLAMGHPYVLAPDATGVRLCIDPRFAESVRIQLEKFDRESAGWPPPRVADPARRRPVVWFPPLFLAMAVIAVFRIQTLRPGILEGAGAVDSTAIFRDGEWWRALTALFLHADANHLGSNLWSGALVFSAVLTTLGRMRGTLVMAMASVTANLAVAAAHYPGDYRSLGASTAIFAGLGVLTGRAVRLAARADPGFRVRGVFIPLAVGLTMLAIHGGGELRADVLAHVAGFAAGGIAGFWGLGRNSR
jgi:rhomboid protease GluP